MEYDKEEALQRARMTVELNNITSQACSLMADVMLCTDPVEAQGIQEQIVQCNVQANELRDQFWSAHPNALVTKSSSWNY